MQCCGAACLTHMAYLPMFVGLLLSRDVQLQNPKGNVWHLEPTRPGRERGLVFLTDKARAVAKGGGPASPVDKAHATNEG